MKEMQDIKSTTRAFAARVGAMGTTSPQIPHPPFIRMNVHAPTSLIFLLGKDPLIGNCS